MPSPLPCKPDPRLENRIASGPFIQIDPDGETVYFGRRTIRARRVWRFVYFHHPRRAGR